MKINQALQNAINNQIQMEFNSAYSYLAMSAYCERTFFPGCAKWLRMQSGEEKDHAMKLFQFMIDRNARIVLKEVPAPPVDFESLAQVFELALAQEEKVSKSINSLYEAAMKEKAFATAVELQWFLTEQVEEEKTARDIVAKFHLVKHDPAALLDLDRELGNRSTMK